MTSLLFAAPYMVHKGFMHQKREKQRVKNYERWEGLRDEYDEQRKISRESRSLDIQRTGTWDQTTGFNNNFEDEGRGMFTLRDQQEANDARTGWRPQEAWDGPRTQVQAQTTGQMQQIPSTAGSAWPQYPVQSHYSSTPAMAQQTPNSIPRRSISSQKTGSTWDEGLPTPLQVSRRSFEDYEYGQRYMGGSAPVTRTVSRRPSQSRRQSSIAETQTQTPSESRFSTPITADMLPAAESIRIIEQPTNEFGFVDASSVKPQATAAAGGRMAELIERGY